MKCFFVVLSLLWIGRASYAQTRPMVIEGTVVGRPYSKTLLLSGAEEDMRIHPPVRVPIVRGSFSFRFEAQAEMAYSLTFADEWERSAWRPTVFFPDGDTVRMILYPMDSASMNRIIGGQENREYRYIDSVFTCETPEFMALDSLQDARYDNGTYYNAEASALRDRLDRETNRMRRDSLLSRWAALREAGKHLTPEAAATERQIQAYFDSVQQERYTYIRNHPSLAGYFWLYRTQLFQPSERSKCEAIYRTVYAPRYPRSPYTARLDTVFYRQVRVGRAFADFEAPDLDGQMHRLSDLIRGRVAVIDLWASWCGPCRRNSMAIIPIYNEFKDKGFEVVGVARETNDADAMRKAVKKDGYPWLNLVELNDRAGIWQLYGIARTAGGQFLIDRDGTVLAIDPTVSEIKRILSEKLR